MNVMRNCEYERKAFLIHKPVNVVCSTVDSAVTNIVQKKNDSNYGSKRGGISRLTVYDIANKAGFPTSYGLVGRLDAETSGIMIFTNNSQFLEKVRNPALSFDEYQTDRENNISNPNINSGTGSYDRYLQAKSKQYELKILSGRTVCKRLIQNNLIFDPTEFERELSESFTFQRNNVTYEINETKVEFKERFQDSKYAHNKPELGWCIKCLVTLHEGKHHQIRRMAHKHDYHVLSLKRVAIADILRIESVPEPGDCRWLTTEEYSSIALQLNVT